MIMNKPDDDGNGGNHDDDDDDYSGDNNDNITNEHHVLMRCQQQTLTRRRRCQTFKPSRTEGTDAITMNDEHMLKSQIKLTTVIETNNSTLSMYHLNQWDQKECSFTESNQSNKADTGDEKWKIHFEYCNSASIAYTWLKKKRKNIVNSGIEKQETHFGYQ